MRLSNFFREDLTEVIGVYFDGYKIFLARLTDKIDFAENIFTPDLNSKDTVIEQIAANISDTCNKLGWKTNQIGFVLRDGEATTFQTEFKNIPVDEVASAIKIWAMAHVAKDVRYTSMEIDGEIWMEALPAAIVEEYTAAFDNNSMTLCAITEIPKFSFDRKLTPYNRAVFAADIVKYKKQPNILIEHANTWNFKNISLTAAAIFLLIMAGFTAKLSYNYFATVAQVEFANDTLNTKSELLALKENIDTNVADISRLNDFKFETGTENKFVALLKIGRTTDTNIILSKIKASNDSIELKGSAESPNAVKNYLSRLKTSSLKNIKLGNSIIDDDKIDFAVRANF